MDALALIPESNTGNIDAKVIVCKYKFVAKNGGFDSRMVDDFLELLHFSQHCHVNVYVEDATTYRDLFTERFDRNDFDDLKVIQVRITKQLPLIASSQDFADEIARGFEPIDGVDGDLHWFEKKEGTASYIRLLNEIPENRRCSTL